MPLFICRETSMEYGGKNLRRWKVKACAMALAAGLLLAVIVMGVMLVAAGGELRTALDGRRERAAEERVTSFSLREQMGREQAEARVRGWLSVVQSETAVVRTDRGRLSAQVFEPIGGEEDAPWALVLHGGLGSDYRQVLDVACMLSLRGYRVLTPDLYAHGRSEGETSSLGVRETEDVRAWIEWIMLEDMDARIVCFGQDEGGAALLLAAADGLPESVKAVAADSAYVSAEARMETLLAETEAARRAKPLRRAAYRLAVGASVEAGDIVGRMALADVPMLLIHGTGDSDVLAWESEDLAAAAGERGRLLLVEGAGHGMARFLEPETYADALLSFFADALNGEISGKP